MAGAPQLPAYIKLAYKDDPAVLEKFVSDVGGAGKRAQSAMQQAMSGVRDTVAQALTVPRNAFGSLDVGVDQLRKMETQLEATATASREVQRALVAEARATEGLTQGKASAIRAAGQFARATEAELSALRQNIAFNERLQAELNKTASATNAVVNATNRGTTAFGQTGESLRGSRQAFVQTGQQLQDLGISLYSGQRASTVFAQQLPQLAFALTSLEGSTNKAQNAIGKFAALLSGPLGSVALVGASIGLGVLVEKLFFAEDAAKKAGNAFETTSEKLDLQKNSVAEVTKALKEYNAEQEKSRVITLETAKATAFKIAEDLRETIAIRTKLKALLEENSTRAAIIFAQSGGNLGSALGAYLAGESQITSKIAEQDALIAELTKGAKNAVIEVADEIAKINSDPSYKLDVGFDALRNDARKAITDFTALQKKLTEINNQEKAAQKALSEANKKPRNKAESYADGVSTFQSREQAIGFLGKQLQSAGLRVSENDQFGGVKANHPGMGNAAHGRYAIDVNVGRGIVEADDPAAKAQIEAAVLQYQSIGYRVVWNGNVYEPFGKGPGKLIAKGKNQHRDHAHFEAPQSIVGRAIDKSGSDVAALNEAKAEAEHFANELQKIDQITQRISSEFDDQPKLIDRISIAGLKLRQTTEDINRQLTDGSLTAEQRLKLETRLLDVKKAQEAVDGALEKRSSDILKAQQDQLEVQRLAASGRGFESELLQEILRETNDIGDLDAAGLADVRDRVSQRILETQQIERQNAALQNQLSFVDNIASASKTAIYDLLSGKGLKAGKNLVGSIFDSYLQAKSEEVYDALLGGVFQKQKLKILGLDKVDEAGREMATKMNLASSGLERLENAAIGAANALAPANDNYFGGTASAVERAIERANGGIVVNGAPKRTTEKTLKELFVGLGDQISFGLGDKIAKAIEGAGIGATLGGIIGGRKGQIIGGGLGALGQLSGQGQLLSSISANLPAIGAAISLNQGLNTLFGNDDRKGGKLLHTVLGPFASALFKKKSGSTTINSTGGDLGYKGSGGYRDGVLGIGGGVQSQLSDIINSLGGSEGAFSVSVGQRGKKFTVDPTGRGRTKGKGVLKFKTEEEAARAALFDAIKDGAVKGLRDGAQRLLQAGKDIDKQLAKAVLFQGVFDRIKEIDDPVGAALDRLDREFTNLKSVFAEAGASAAEYADLQRLYDMDRAKAIEEANSRITASLKSLYADLTINNDALSLRDRQSAAKAVYDPLAARVAAGDKTAYDAYADAAKSLLDIERSLYGSQSGYFDRLSEVTNLTKARIDEESNVTSIDRLGLTFTDAISTQTNALLSGLQPALLALNTNIGTLIGQGFGAGRPLADYQTAQSF